MAVRLGLPVLTAAELEAAAASERQVHVLRGSGFLERTPLWYYLLAGRQPVADRRAEAGRRRRWTDIFSLNRDAIGDPDEIAPGLKLVLLKR